MIAFLSTLLNMGKFDASSTNQEWTWDNLPIIPSFRVFDVDWS